MKVPALDVRPGDTVEVQSVTYAGGAVSGRVTKMTHTVEHIVRRGGSVHLHDQQGYFAAVGVDATLNVTRPE